MRVTVGSDFWVDLLVYGDELLAAADSVPTVTVTDPAGSVVTTGSVATLSTGYYRAKVEARSEVTRLKVVWDYVLAGDNHREISYVAVDGAYVFNLSELRALPELKDAERYPLGLLSRARSAAVDYINDYTRSAFVETYAREVMDGISARKKLLVSRVPATRIISVTVDGSAVSTAGFTISESGLVRGPSQWQTSSEVGRNVAVEYAYGVVPTPGDLKGAALRLAASTCIDYESTVPDRARMMTTQWGTFQLSVANDDYPSGIPAVDSVLRRHKIWIPSFA